MKLTNFLLNLAFVSLLRMPAHAEHGAHATGFLFYPTNPGALQARAREIAISVRSRVPAESQDTDGFVEDSASSDSAAVEVDGCVVTPHIAVSNGSCIHAKSVKSYFFFHADIAQW